HVNACGDHGGRMDERAHGRRTFHSVRQPDVEWNLRRFAGGTHEQGHSNRNEYGIADMKRARHDAFTNLFAKGLEVNTTARNENQHDADGQSPVSDAVDDERLLGSIAGTFLVKVVTDEQVRTETYTFPTDEHHQVVAPEHEREHRE